jgi:hypothetical protein
VAADNARREDLRRSVHRDACGRRQLAVEMRLRASKSDSGPNFSFVRLNAANAPASPLTA